MKKELFSNEEISRYADVILWGMQKARGRRYTKGDIVLVRFNLAALSLAEKVQQRILETGMHPVMRFVATPGMERNFFTLSDAEQLVFTAPGEKELFRRLNGSIYLNAPDSLTHLQGVDPSNIAKTAVSRKKLRDILVRREETKDFGWTLCSFPTREMAKHARMSQTAYAAQIKKACYLDRKDPAAEWDEIFNNAQEIKKRLNSLNISHFLIESDQIDLKIFQGEKRKWVGVSGHNIPSFELFTSPDWRGTEGRYVANQPCYMMGNYVKGAGFEFKKGVVVNTWAEQGEAFVKKQIAMDNGASKIGEFSLTDVRFSRIDRFMADTLFDENYGGKFGNCHIALGASYSDTFNGNPSHLTKPAKKRLGFNDSALHWDLVNTEKKRVTAHLLNGKKMVIYENGKFKF